MTLSSHSPSNETRLNNQPETRILTDEVNSSPILDFEQYSNTIASMIRSSDPRFSIGIYGELGTGKTTLMRSIETKISDNNTMIV
jgi:ATPase subunit of ABC transporter with duplicated ATPase domains